MKILIPDYLIKENREKIKTISCNGVVVEGFNISSKGRGILSCGNNFELHVNGKVIKDKLEDVRVFITPSYLDKTMTDFLVSKLPGLEWIYSTRTGVEEFLIKPVREKKIILTNSRLCSESIAEFILALILCVQKKLYYHFELQKKGISKFIASQGLRGKKVGILGFGRIGKAVARRLKENGMIIWIWDKVRQNNYGLIDRFIAYENLDELLKNCDFIITSLPLTQETQYLVSQREIDLIKNDAWIINVGRGGLIDGRALYESLQSRKIGGACLDLLDKFLNKKIKKLSRLGNLILTHHSSFYYPEYNGNVIDIFIRELNNFINNKPLENLVDAEKGY